MNSRFLSKTQWQMFQLGSGRHVGAPNAKVSKFDHELWQSKLSLRPLS